MVNGLFLCIVTVGVSLQSIIKKYYGNKCGGRGAFVFSAVSVFAACLFFVACSGFKLEFKTGFLLYALGFALAYGVSSVFSFLAIKSGSLSLTSLIVSYSLVIPTFYGLFFLGESVSIPFWIGFALLMISLFLVNGGGESSRISLLWIVFVLLAFIGNGLCSAIQTAQQKAFSGEYKNEFMIIALLTVCIIMAVCSVICERSEIGECLKKGWHVSLACGIINGIVKLLVMLLVSRMNAAIMFPIISAGGIIISWLVARFVYKEALTAKQNIAMLLGTASVVLMNL